MKKQILSAALVVGCVSAPAQGSFLFNNFGGGANAPVFDTDGTTKLGNAFQADLYWGHGTVTDSSTLTALGSPVTFSGSGYFIGGTHSIPGTTAETITAQVRVWDSASGGSWLQAWQVPGARLGESALFSLALVTGTTPPNTLANLQSFSLQFIPVPEPSTLTLVAAGLVAMLVLRRRSTRGAVGLLRSFWPLTPSSPGACSFSATTGIGVNASVTDRFGHRLNCPGFTADLYWLSWAVTAS